MTVKESPLRFIRGSQARIFPAKPEGETLTPGAGYSWPLVAVEDWQAVSGASYRATSTPLPAGYEACWDLSNSNGRIRATFTVPEGHSGETVTLSARVWSRSAASYGVMRSVEWDTGESVGSGLAVAPATAGTFSDFSAWAVVTFDETIPAGATSATVEMWTIDATQRVYLIDVEITPPETALDEVAWACLPFS